MEDESCASCTYTPMSSASVVSKQAPWLQERRGEERREKRGREKDVNAPAGIIEDQQNKGKN